MKPFKDTYVMYQLLEFINESSIIALCKTSKKLNEIYKNYIELEDDKRFKIILTQFKYGNSILLEKYCENNDIIKIRKMIKIDIELIWRWGLTGACEGGHIDIVKLMIEKDAVDLWDGMLHACKGGNLDIVKFMIEKGTDDWNWGLWDACKGGNLDIVKLMIEKGANSWNWGLCDACDNGHIDIVKFVIKKGADKCYYCNKSIEEHLSKK